MQRSRARESELSIHSQNGLEDVQKIKFMQVNSFEPSTGGEDRGVAPWQAWWGAGGGGENELLPVYLGTDVVVVRDRGLFAAVNPCRLCKSITPRRRSQIMRGLIGHLLGSFSIF